MRIIYISKYVGFGELAPTRQYFLARALSAMDCQVMLVGSRSNAKKSGRFLGPKKVWQEDNLTNVCLNGPLVSFGMNAKRVVSWIIFELMLLTQVFYLRKFKPDILIVSSLSVLTLGTGVLLKKLLNCKLVVEVRDIYPLTLIEIGGFSHRHPIVTVMGWIERKAYRNADLLISPLEKFDLHAAETTGSTAPFEWIPMGFDDSFKSAPLTRRGAVVAHCIEGLKATGKFVIVYAGTIGSANALDSIFKAASLCLQTRYQFVFIGDGPLKAEYRRKFGSLANVVFFDSVPKADVHHILQGAHLLLNTWHNKPMYRFGISPNKLIDYALSGRPFVTNLQTDLKILRLYDNAFITNGDCVESLLAMIENISAMPPSELNEIGERGRASLYQNFHYSVLAKTLIGAFERHGLSGKTFEVSRR